MMIMNECADDVLFINIIYKCLRKPNTPDQKKWRAEIVKSLVACVAYYKYSENAAQMMRKYCNIVFGTTYETTTLTYAGLLFFLEYLIDSCDGVEDKQWILKIYFDLLVDNERLCIEYVIGCYRGYVKIVYYLNNYVVDEVCRNYFHDLNGKILLF